MEVSVTLVPRGALGRVTTFEDSRLVTRSCSVRVVEPGDFLLELPRPLSESSDVVLVYTDRHLATVSFIPWRGFGVWSRSSYLRIRTYLSTSGAESVGFGLMVLPSFGVAL